jgi:hypothetical protein
MLWSVLRMAYDTYLVKSTAVRFDKGIRDIIESVGVAFYPID